MNSNDYPAHRIAQPALHDLAIRQLDEESRLEPRHAAGQSEIMEWGRRALAATTEQLLCSAHPESPLDGATEQQSTAEMLTNEDAGERMRQAEKDLLATDETDALTVLKGEHPPAVVFFLPDPAGTVERLADQRRLHRHQRVRKRHGDYCAAHVKITAPWRIDTYR